MQSRAAPARLRVIPDSVDARLLVEVASHEHDLAEAETSLELARATGQDSTLWTPLIHHAVVAYCRCFVASKVRRPLDAIIEIPTDLRPVHEMLRSLRNTTIAHSQSELTMTVAAAALNPDGSLRTVVPMTVSHDVPIRVADDFADLLTKVQASALSLSAELSARLLAHLKDASPATISSWASPGADASTAKDFTARSSRRHQPSFTFYWDVRSNEGKVEGALDPTRDAAPESAK